MTGEVPVRPQAAIGGKVGFWPIPSWTGGTGKVGEAPAAAGERHLRE